LPAAEYPENSRGYESSPITPTTGFLAVLAIQLDQMLARPLTRGAWDEGLLPFLR
jgi:hypothetical protein